jgi:hypothetical protein
MTKITEFDSSACNIVSKRVEEALKSLGEELGLSFQTKGGNYGSSNYAMKIEAAVINKDGTVSSKEAETFKQMAKLYGLKPEDLGQEITVGRSIYTIRGLKPRSRKYPVTVDRNDGKGFKLPVSTVQRALGRKVTEEIY